MSNSAEYDNCMNEFLKGYNIELQPIPQPRHARTYTSTKRNLKKKEPNISEKRKYSCSEELINCILWNEDSSKCCSRCCIKSLVGSGVITLDMVKELHIIYNNRKNIEQTQWVMDTLRTFEKDGGTQYRYIFKGHIICCEAWRLIHGVSRYRLKQARKNILEKRQIPKFRKKRTNKKQDEIKKKLGITNFWIESNCVKQGNKVCFHKK